MKYKITMTREEVFGEVELSQVLEATSLRAAFAQITETSEYTGFEWSCQFFRSGEILNPEFAWFNLHFEPDGLVPGAEKEFEILPPEMH